MNLSDLFKEIIPSILQTKKVEVTQENERDYVPFVVNKALSFHHDCVLYANEMNKVPNIDGILQYQFLLNRIRGYKRPFQKWQKRETIEDLDTIKEYYKCSTEKAKEVLTVLNDGQIDEIRKRLNRGGIEKRKRVDKT